MDDRFKPDFFQCCSCDYSGDFRSLANHLIRLDHMDDDEIKQLLLEYLEEFCSEYDYVTQEVFNENACVSSKTYGDRFETWNKALEKASGSVIVRQNIPKKDLLSELERVSEIVGESPSQSDVQEYSKYSVKPYKSKFGSFNKAKECAGMETYSLGDVQGERNGMYGKSEESTFYGVTGEDHPAYIHGEGSTSYYGPFWERIVEEIRERDNNKCRVCGMDNDDHLEKNNKSLDVHHIKPKYEFEDENGEVDYAEANKEENLITVCKHCHGKIEGKFEQCRNPQELVEEFNNE